MSLYTIWSIVIMHFDSRRRGNSKICTYTLTYDFSNRLMVFINWIWTFEHFSFHNSRTVRQRDIGTFTLAVLESVLSEWQISAYFEKQMVWRNKTTRKLGGGGGGRANLTISEKFFSCVLYWRLHQPLLNVSMFEFWW